MCHSRLTRRSLAPLHAAALAALVGTLLPVCCGQVFAQGLLDNLTGSPTSSVRPQTAGNAQTGLVVPVFNASTPHVQVADGPGREILRQLRSPNERVELTVNSSRILTLEGKIPRAQVNNPDILTVTPLSPNEIQIAAIKPGVTQLNLWDENGRIYTVDVTVYGDVRELQATLKRLFPHSSVRAFRISNSLVLDGFVDQPNNVSTIMRLAEDYAPKVISNISVGGVQQIVLNVELYEVSRTKLRALGFDFANLNGNDFVISSVSGLISAAATQAGTATGTGGDTIRFGIVDGSNSFFGFLKALRQNDLMKILAEPKLVTVSGRPASFNSGGEFPVIVPQSLGTVSIEYKKFGTQVDFLPIVLGNGNIRLEVRPRVSEIDNTRSVVIDDFVVPGLRVREVDTGVEMKAGQTLAIAGLVQTRVEAQNLAVPWLGDMPFIGSAFRSVEETTNEIELLILVRPDLVDPLDPHEVPPCGPGTFSTSPSDTELYWKGHLEVPACNGCVRPDCRHGHGNIGPFGPAQELESSPIQTPPMPEAPAPPQSSARRRARPVGNAAMLPSRYQRGGGFVDRRLGTPQAQLARQPAQPFVPPQIQQGVVTQPVVVQPQAQPQPPYLQTRANRYQVTDQNTAGQPNNANSPGLIGPVGYDVLK